MSRLLRLDSVDEAHNPFLKHYRQQLADAAGEQLHELVAEVERLGEAVQTQEYLTFGRRLSKSIAWLAHQEHWQGCQRLAETYLTRSRLHLNRHKRHRATTPYVAALLDLRAAQACFPRPITEQTDDALRQMRRALKTASKASPERSLPKTLTLITKSLAEVGTVRPDEGYRSRTPSPHQSRFVECQAPSKGRLLRAACDLHAGQLLFSETAFVSCLEPDVLASHCSHCTRRLTSRLAKCPRNCPLVFCSASCRQQAWPLHRHECAVQAVLLNCDSLQQMAIRFFQRCSNADPAAKDAAALSHHFLRYSSPRRLRTIVAALFTGFLLQQMGLLQVAYDMENGCPSLSRILTHMCQARTNAVSLTDTNNIGYAIFPNFSLLSHACNANLLYTHKDYGLTMVAGADDAGDGSPPRICLVLRRDVKAGAELTVSYTSNASLVERQQKLRQHYFFHCFCDACLTEMRKAPVMELLLKSMIPLGRCPSCHQQLTKCLSLSVACMNVACCDSGQEIDLERKLTFMRDKLQSAKTEVLACDLQRLLRIRDNCNRCLDQLSLLFPEASVLHLDFFVFLCQVCRKLRDLHQSLVWAGKSLTTSLRLLGSHRETAMAYRRLLSCCDALADSEPDQQDMTPDERSRHELSLATPEDVAFMTEEIPSDNCPELWLS